MDDDPSANRSADRLLKRDDQNDESQESEGPQQGQCHHGEIDQVTDEPTWAVVGQGRRVK